MNQPKRHSERREPQAKLTVLHEDNHSIVVFKPAGMLTQADRGGETCAMDVVKTWLKQKYGKQGNVFLGLVHRLDRPVSGVLVFAKTSKGASRISEQMRERRFKKVYWAVVEGTPREGRKRLADYLVKDDSGRISVTEDERGQLAILSYRVLKRGKESSLLEILLETGRKHQIRAQMAYLGCPVAGDGKYGARKRYPHLDGIALMAKLVEFQHPTTGEKIRVEVPDDSGFLERWLK